MCVSTFQDTSTVHVCSTLANGICAHCHAYHLVSCTFDFHSLVSTLFLLAFSKLHYSYFADHNSANFTYLWHEYIYTHNDYISKEGHVTSESTTEQSSAKKRCAGVPCVVKMTVTLHIGFVWCNSNLGDMHGIRQIWYNVHVWLIYTLYSTRTESSKRVKLMSTSVSGMHLRHLPGNTCV